MRPRSVGSLERLLELDFHFVVGVSGPGNLICSLPVDADQRSQRTAMCAVDHLRRQRAGLWSSASLINVRADQREGLTSLAECATRSPAHPKLSVAGSSA